MDYDHGVQLFFECDKNKPTANLLRLECIKLHPHFIERIMTTRTCLKKELETNKKHSSKKVVVDSPVTRQMESRLVEMSRSDERTNGSATCNHQQ